MRFLACTCKKIFKYCELSPVSMKQKNLLSKVEWSVNISVMMNSAPVAQVFRAEFMYITKSEIGTLKSTA